MTMIYTGSTISFMQEGKFQQVHSSHPKFQSIVDLCKEGNFGAAAELVDLKAAVTKALVGTEAELRNDNVYFRGEIVRSILAERIITMSREGFDAKPLLLFLENLMLNPSKRAVDELYGFLEASSLPITDDGCFLAYKSIRDNYTDHHTGTMDNSVGKVVSMERNKVDEDKDRTCSYGLHFAAHEYAQGFGGGRMVVLKINPRDVVAIPSDYANQKGRCARYEVVEEVERSDTKLVNKAYVDTGATLKATLTSRLPIGTRVMISPDSMWAKGTPSNPMGIAGTVAPYVSTLLPVRVEWDNGDSNSYDYEDLLVVDEEPLDTYVPQESNYDNEELWSEFIGILSFEGQPKEFPVNRDVPYLLERKSTGKEYRGEFYFTAYDKGHDNLVFARMGHDGKPNRYVTISDVSDWHIQYDLDSVNN